MKQPESLKQDTPLVWSTGSGTDVWALFRSCIDGDLDAAKKLLRKDANLVRSHYDYRTALYFAARENQLSIAEHLLDLAPNPLAHNYGDRLFTIARERGYEEMLQLLRFKLKQRHRCSEEGEHIAAAIRNKSTSKLQTRLTQSPELLQTRDFYGNQAIHWAVMTRNAPLIIELLELGADINARRLDGATPIQLTNGDYHFRGWNQLPRNHPSTPQDILDLLRHHGARLDLCTASHIGDLSAVKKILRQAPEAANQASDYISYYPCSGTPIRNAAGAGHKRIVQILLDHGADPNLPEEGIAPQGQALYMAAANGHYPVVERLLQHGAHPNVMVESSGDTLSRVIANQDTKMLNLLCSHGAAQSLDMLAYYNDIRTAAAILDVNPKLADNPDALANAASDGHEAFVKLLLRTQPKLATRLVYPSWAVGAKTKRLNQFLFTNGYHPNQSNWLEISPLHEFSRQGALEKAKLFLEHGANIHARDEHLCSTPLGWAARYGQAKMVALLLEWGAKPNHPEDPHWARPLTWAVRRKHPRVARILSDARASDH